MQSLPRFVSTPGGAKFRNSLISSTWCLHSTLCHIEETPSAMGNTRISAYAPNRQLSLSRVLASSVPSPYKHLGIDF